MKEQSKKQEWAAFIAEKRKQKGLTQKELAQHLYVGNSAVSKWERGLSYPDITLVVPLCKELGISEHEFFIACDDLNTRQQAKQARGFRFIQTGLINTLSIGYILSIIICFITNLAINHTLSWFWIVLVSIMLSFSITLLPLHLKQHRFLVSAAAATILIFILEAVCCYYLKEKWLGKAYLITCVPVILCWLCLLTLCVTRWKLWFKAGIISFLLAVTTVVMNPWVAKIIQDSSSPSIYDYLSPLIWSADTIATKLVAYFFIILAIGCFIRCYILKGVEK